MIRNYIKITWRILVRNKVYATINIAGLSLSMICAMLITLWIDDEQSYETFFPNSEQIYRLIDVEQHDDGSVVKGAAVPAPLPGVITEKFPEILNFARVLPRSNENLINVGSTILYENVTYVDSTFFEIFQFEFLEGSSENALSGLQSMVITERMASKLFGTDWLSTGVLGQEVTIGTKENFQISGVIKNLPKNTHFDFDVLLPFAKIYTYNWNLSWRNYIYYAYFDIAKGTDIATLSDKIATYADSNDELEDTFYLQALEDIHLYSDLSIDLYGSSEPKYQYVNIFYVVAFCIIFIACINFMNLSTARSEKRAKEIGLRKTIGARKGNIIEQLLGESMFLAIISFCIALLLTFLILPYFNALVGKNLVFGIGQWRLLLIFCGGTIMVGLLAGSYPAFYLSAFRPIKVLKGTHNSIKGGKYFRQVLVTLQFAIALIMVTGTIIIYQQFQFFIEKDLGYDKDLLIFLPRRGEIWNHYPAFKTELQQNPLIKNVSVSSDLPTYTTHSFDGFDWSGKSPESTPIFHAFSVGYDYFEVLGLKIIEGRAFSPEFPTDSTNFILNETALKMTGLASPIGEKFSLWDRHGKIVGIVKDFNFKSLHQKVEPLVLKFNPYWDAYYFIKIAPENVDGAIKVIANTWEKYNPAYPFEYHFLDEEYENLYISEKRMAKIFNYFTFFILFITCLGLFGLITYLAEQKKKEIGIRKILGASITSILVLLSKEFATLILLSFVIGIPVANYFLTEWLNGFAYRIPFTWWLFAIPGGVILLISLLTVSGQSLKAAMLNPIESLRRE
ncbi:MAG: ABC transporter permease [Bacteroidota bacterium]